MAFLARVYTPSNIFQGPADVYVGLTAPASALVPTADSNTLTLDALGQPTSSTGFHAGLVEAPTMPTITEKNSEIEADQFETAVDLAHVSIEAEIDFNLMETNLSRIQQMFSNNSLVTYNSVTGAQVLQFGGVVNAAMNFTTICAIAQRRDNTAKFNYWFLYRAYLASALQLTWDRSKPSVWKCKFKGVADTSRVLGDELMGVVRTK